MGAVLDAPDGPALARFYARLLDWQVFGEDESGAPQMSMHLDVEVDDLERAVAHALACGAAQAAFQPQADVRVMLDPAGHPSCLYLDPALRDG